MLDPTKRYECDAGEVIGLHGPDSAGAFVAIIRKEDGRLWTAYYGAASSLQLNTGKYTLRPLTAGDGMEEQS
jgi:hypothetical protein